MEQEKNNVEEKVSNVDIAGIKKSAKAFIRKEYVGDDYPLVKKEELENAVFIVFSYNTVNDEGSTYYNFKALNINYSGFKKDEIFCFNGSNILATQLDEAGMPCRVKLVKALRDNKLRPYYWVFSTPDV